MGGCQQEDDAEVPGQGGSIREREGCVIPSVLILLPPFILNHLKYELLWVYSIKENDPLPKVWSCCNCYGYQVAGRILARTTTISWQVVRKAEWRWLEPGKVKELSNQDKVCFRNLCVTNASTSHFALMLLWIGFPCSSLITRALNAKCSLLGAFRKYWLVGQLQTSG